MTKKANKVRHKAILANLERAGVIASQHPTEAEISQSYVEARLVEHERVRATWEGLRRRGLV